MATAILACSPGTRAFGLVVLRDGKAVELDVLTFRKSWSQDKLDAILKRVADTIRKYEIERVAVKVPDVFPTTMGFNQLIGCLNVLLEKNGINAHYFTLQELKDYCVPDKTGNKQHIVDLAIQKHSELLERFSSTGGKLSNHHFKLFEAICAGHLLRHI